MRKCKGFTLIELLVVIAIIVVLLAILMPSLKKARNQTRTVVCQSNLKQWGTLLVFYTDDNDGFMPSDHKKFAYLLGDPYQSLGNANITPQLINRNSKPIAAYGYSRPQFPQPDTDDPNAPPTLTHNFGTKGIRLCPMAKKATPCNVTIGFRYNDEFVKAKPGAKNSAWIMKYPVPEILGSYGFSQGIINFKYTRGIKVDSAKNRYKTPVLLDCGMPYGSITGQCILNNATFTFKTTSPPEENYRGENFCMNRHDGFVNSLFFDWSVRKIGLKELWTLKWYKNFDTANEMTLAGGVEPEDWPEWMRKFKDY